MLAPARSRSAVCGADRSEIGPYLGGGSGKGRGSCYRLANARGALGVGRCLRQRRVCGAGPLGDRSLPRRWFEEGTRVLVQAGQGPVSSGGRAMSPTAPRLRCGPLGDRSLPGRWFGEGTRVLLQAGQGPASSGGRAMSPTAPLPAPARVAALQTDRSEIGPYLGGGSGDSLGRTVAWVGTTLSRKRTPSVQAIQLHSKCIVP